MRTLLLTAFEPFDGELINPSLEIAQMLDNEQIDHVKVVSKILPCVFDSSLEALETAIREVKPDYIISLGQAGGRSDITPERVAINLNDARIPDNKGNQPIDQTIDNAGPAAYFTTLPIKAMVDEMQQRGIPASVSYSAGTFVCNHVFYGLQQLAQKYNIPKSGFVHIPYLPEQAVNHPGKPSMAKSMLVDGLRIMIQTAVSTDKDIKAVGGQLH